MLFISKTLLRAMNASGAGRHGWALLIARTCTAVATAVCLCVCVCARASAWARTLACVRA